MNLNFKDKTYLVTGGNSGIGLGVCQALDKAGAKLVVCSRSEQNFELLKNELQSKEHFFLKVDLLSYESIESSVQVLKAAHNVALDGAVFCAGAHMLRPLKMMKPENWTSAFMVNALGPAHLFKTLVSSKLVASESSFIFLSSIAAIKAESGACAYSGSKGALISLARSFAAEVSPNKIRVNCISPGVVDTRMSREMFTKLPTDSIDALKKRHLLGLGEIADIVDPILFLLSRHSRWMTGQNLVVDGGFSIV